MHNGVKPGTPVLIPHVESARGVLRCEEIALASTRIAGLSLGAYDYVADLGVARTAAGRELDFARGVIVHVCAAYGLQALDVVYADLQDEAGLIAEAEHAKAIGFKGKYVVHPDQVAPVNRVFQPSEAELDQARRIVEAFDAGVAQGHASVQVEGRMVDTPVAKRARDLIAFAEAVSNSS